MENGLCWGSAISGGPVSYLCWTLKGIDSPMAFHTGYYCCPGQTTIWVIISYPPLLLLYFPSDVIFFISCPKLLCASKIAISFLHRADWFSAVLRTPCRCKKEINRTSGEKNSVQAVFSLHIHCNAWSSRINPRPFQLFSTQCPEMQNHSGPFLLGTMWICSDSPSWEEFAAWMPKTVQINISPAKAERLGQGHPHLCGSLGTSSAAQAPDTRSLFSLSSVSFPSWSVYIFLSWCGFWFLVIFNSLLSSSDNSMKSLKVLYIKIPKKVAEGIIYKNT